MTNVCSCFEYGFRADLRLNPPVLVVSNVCVHFVKVLPGSPEERVHAALDSKAKNLSYLPSNKKKPNLVET